MDHGHHALFVLDAFRALGGYDETFIANEDAEFDRRLTNSGGRIWLSEDLAIVYHPRRTPAALFAQYLRHGAGRARMLLRHTARGRGCASCCRPRLRRPCCCSRLPFLSPRWRSRGALGAGLPGLRRWLGLKARDACAAVGAGLAAMIHAPGLVAWLLAPVAEAAARYSRLAQ